MHLSATESHGRYVTHQVDPLGIVMRSVFSSGNKSEESQIGASGDALYGFEFSWL